MGAMMPAPVHATPRKRLADVCLTPAKASLPAPDGEASVLFECIEATAAKFKLSDKEMSDKLRVSPSNYSRRTYNAARVQFLDLEQRRYFTTRLAKAEGLHAEPPTPKAQVKAAAKEALMTLLDLMEAE